MASVTFGFTEELKPDKRIGESGVQSQTDPAGIKAALRKMPFIAHKLQMTKVEIGTHLDRHIKSGWQEPDRPLPAQYVELLRAWIAVDSPAIV
jgi:hypothetical protein